MSKLKDIETIIKAIHNSFPIHPLPDEYDLSGESWVVNQYLKGKTWTEVTAESICAAKHDSIEAYLSFLRPKAVCYFFPAYMMMNINGYETELSWIYESLYYHLTPNYARSHCFIATDSNRQPADSYFLSRIEPLNDRQRTTIADFLYHQSLHNGTELRLDDLWNEGPRKAFDAYWYQFASQD